MAACTVCAGDPCTCPPPTTGMPTQPQNTGPTDTLAGGGTITNTYVTNAVTHGTPPEFLKDKGGLAKWKDNILRWDRVTKLDPTERGDIILMMAPDDNTLKDTLVSEIGKELIGNKDGVQLIISTLEKHFGEDEILEGFMKFKELIRKERLVGQDMLQYLTEWEIAVKKLEERNITLDDRVQGFLLLLSCNLEDMDLTMVMENLDRNSTVGKATVYSQIRATIKRLVATSQLKSLNSGAKTLYTENALNSSY